MNERKRRVDMPDPSSTNAPFSGQESREKHEPSPEERKYMVWAAEATERKTGGEFQDKISELN